MLSIRQPENWLYEIWQKGQENPCYVVVPNAKDLVKSHLMIAVREEVEVLKEKISELMDKINHLEVENTILKSNLSQESLQQLQMQTRLQIEAAASIKKASAKPPAIADSSALATAATATPRSNVGSGTATPTTQWPITGTVDQRAANASGSQGSVQATS